MLRRSSSFVTIFLFTMLFLITPMARGGGGGGGIVTPFHVCKSGPHAAQECMTDAQCPKSTCIGTTFPPGLSRICQSGSQEGSTCLDDGDCESGYCVISFVDGKPKVISALLTLVTDDTETRPVDNEEPICGAVTIILEVKAEGKKHRLAQTYVCPEESSPEVEFLRTEAGLHEAVTDASILNRILFRAPDSGTDDPAFNEMSHELVTLFGVPETSRPIVVGVPKVIKPSDYTDYTDRASSNLASVLQLEIDIRFVTP